MTGTRGCRGGKVLQVHVVTGPEHHAPARELLVANHSFPGEYILKAFGPGGGEFRDAVVAGAQSVLGPGRLAASERATKSGHKVCVTLTIQADTVDEVIQIYGQVHTVDGLALIL